MVDFRMNQAASAAQRLPAGSTATASSCCPLFNNLFFMNTFAPQAPLISASEVAQQCPQLLRMSTQQRPSYQPANVGLPSQQALNQHLAAASQQQQQQQLSQRPHDHTNSNLNTSNLNTLQHLVANNHSAQSCMYMAAANALAQATAGFQNSQHHTTPRQQPQNHQPTPITQATNNTTATAANPAASAPATANTTNRVPLLNLNNYSSAQPFLDLSTLPAPPVAAHFNSSPIANIQRLTNSISNSNAVAQNLAPTSNNATVQSATSNQQPQQQASAIRNAPTLAQQQQQQQAVPTQQSFQNLDNQMQAILINQLFPANQTYTAGLTVQTNHAQQPQQQQQQIVAPQVNSSRPQTLSQAGQMPVVMQHAQQITTQIPQQRQQSTELVSEGRQQQQAYQQTHTTTSRNDTFAPSNHTTTNIYQSNGASNLQHQVPAEPVSQSSQQQHTSPQPHFVPQQQQQPQQPQPAIPPMPMYSAPQMEQALALLTNPVANNLFSHVLNLLYMRGLGSEAHDSYQHQSHHFHHTSHNPHNHHHHHHSNGQATGQDATMPMDSLAISESKPRGLNRAEIDSLTPYIHTNEKDARTCVICLSKFELKSKIRPLPCNHAFHAKCVDKWLRANRTCPICRRDALRAYNPKLKRI